MRGEQWSGKWYLEGVDQRFDQGWTGLVLGLGKIGSGLVCYLLGGFYFGFSLVLVNNILDPFGF